MATPYTDADVDLVASTFVAEAKKNPVEPGRPPWLGVQTRMLLAPTEHDIARAVLDALAAAGRLAPTDDDHRHIIQIREDGWTIKHPLACRPDLFNCPVNRVAGIDLSQLDGPPAPPGFYECSSNDLGDRFLLGDRVDQAEG